VTPAAQGRVDVPAPRRGREHLDDLIGHHGDGHGCRVEGNAS
jgi:hypothetical protein